MFIHCRIVFPKLVPFLLSGYYNSAVIRGSSPYKSTAATDDEDIGSNSNPSSLALAFGSSVLENLQEQVTEGSGE